MPRIDKTFLIDGIKIVATNRTDVQHKAQTKQQFSKNRY
jgi:hypothetical protein